MKKLTSILLCTVMIMTMLSMTLSVSATSAEQELLEIGTKTVRSGSSFVIEDTTGYRVKSIQIHCSLTHYTVATGHYVLAKTEAIDPDPDVEDHAVPLNDDSYIGLFFWNTDNSTTNYFNRSNTTGNLHQFPKTGASATYKATAGHDYESVAYGHCVVGTTIQWKSI